MHLSRIIHDDTGSDTALQGQFQEMNQRWTDSSHPAPVRSTTMPKSAYNTDRITPFQQNEFTFELSYYFLTGEGIMSVANSWLPSLVASEKFFTPCSKCSDHHSSRESTLNFWDIDRQEELCSVCLHDYPRENVLQVCRVRICSVSASLGFEFWAMSVCPVGERMGWEANRCEGSDLGGKTFFSTSIAIEMHMKNIDITIKTIQKGADRKEKG
jgi:hypothetical protein